MERERKGLTEGDKRRDSEETWRMKRWVEKRKGGREKWYGWRKEGER